MKPSDLAYFYTLTLLPLFTPHTPPRSRRTRLAFLPPSMPMDISFRADHRGSPPAWLSHRSDSSLGPPGAMQGPLPRLPPSEGEAAQQEQVLVVVEQLLVEMEEGENRNLLQLQEALRGNLVEIKEELKRQFGPDSFFSADHFMPALPPCECDAGRHEQFLRLVERHFLKLEEELNRNLVEVQEEFRRNLVRIKQEVRCTLVDTLLGVLQRYFVERHEEFDRNQVKIHEVLKRNLVEIEEEMQRMFGPDHFMPPLPMNEPPLNEPAPMQLGRRQSALPPSPQMPFQRSQALSSKTMVPGMKRKADAIVATTVPKKIQKPALDWRCHVNEAGLNEHLGGSTHQGKLPDHGARKAIGVDKTYSLMTTGNNNGPIHEVVQKDNLLCDQCDFRCSNDETMVVHLRSEKHCIKVLTLMKAARENTKSKEYFGLSL